MHDPLGQLRLRFVGLELRTEGPQGQVYAGRDFTGTDVTVAVLAEEAAADPARKQAFNAAVRQRESDDPAAVHSVDLYASQPWAAVRAMPGQPGAEALLDAVDASTLAPSGFDSHTAQPSVFQPATQPTTGPTTRPATASRQQAGRPVVAAAVAILVVVGGATFYLFGALGDDGTEQPPPAQAAPTNPAAADPGPTGSPANDARSALRDVEPVSVIGPVWEPGDDTYTMAFPGWPFAFRTPSTWQCVMGVYDPVPDALAWQCVDTDQVGSGQRVNVMLWECPTTCTEAERQDMIDAWLDEPDLAVPASSDRTVYVETERNIRDHYAVDLSHFAPDPGEADGPLRWHVGVYLESPPDTRDTALKILNDIITQSS